MSGEEEARNRRADRRLGTRDLPDDAGTWVLVAAEARGAEEARFRVLGLESTG
jgi:hypothetical protein